jgi:cell division protein FtsL
MSARSQSLPHTGARLTARAAILGVLVVIVAALSIVPTRQFLAQRAQIAKLEQDAGRLEQANGQLESQIAKLHDSSELERLARECLGMVKPGETAFVTVPKHGEPQPSRC